MRDDQSASADRAVLVLLAAEDGSFEVVVVDARPVAALVVRIEDVLDALPGLRVDKRLVAAVVFNAAVTDDAFVVRVPQELVEMRVIEGPRRPAYCR